MLPALTIRRRWVRPRRELLAICSAVLALDAVAAQITTPTTAATGPSLADELRPSSWAMLVPTAWLAAPVPRVRRGDALDLLGIRSGDKAYAVPVAYGVAVLAVDERGLLLEVDENDASAIATARGGGMLLVPLLRSTR